MLMLLPALRRITDVNAPIQRGLAAAESVFALIDEVSEDDTGSVTLGRAQGQIDFENVTFTYPGAERPALAEISLTVQPGECVALVGASGSGKTTIANLLPRFFAVDQGEIRIDGHSLSEVQLRSLRENIALVSQDVVLFNDTIAANIAYGAKRDATPESIRSAARAAHALEFVDSLPDGFETMIGENGVKLSGGQRQRLAIARALLTDPRILILDDSTSAIDSATEDKIQQAIHRVLEGRTTFLITHRLSMIRRADLILMLDKGRIVDIGAHEALMGRNRLYQRIFARYF